MTESEITSLRQDMEVLGRDELFVGIMLQRKQIDTLNADTARLKGEAKVLLPDYKVIEARVEAEVLRRFGLPATLPPEVKQADRLALAIEQRALMPTHSDVWDCELHPDYARNKGLMVIAPTHAVVARKLFMARFRELLGSKVPEPETDWSAA